MSILIVFLTDARTAFQLYKKERKRRSRAFRPTRTLTQSCWRDIVSRYRQQRPVRLTSVTRREWVTSARPCQMYTLTASNMALQPLRIAFVGYICI